MCDPASSGEVLVIAMTHMRYLPIVLASLGLPACSQPMELRTGLVVILDQVSVQPSTELLVAFTVKNVGSNTEHVPACGDRVNPVIERRRPTDWHPHAGGICPADRSWMPIPLNPGQSLSALTGAARSDPGTYRLVVSYAADETARVVSKAFHIP